MVRDPIRIHDVAFTPAGARARARGVLGYVAVCMNDGVRVPGFKVVRLPDGRHQLWFPTKLDEHGVHHAVLEPRGPAARRSIERQVFAELRLQGWLT